MAILTQDDLRVVQEALERTPGPDSCRASIRKGMQSLARDSATYAPLIRFVLEDRTRGTFRAERIFYSGDEGWIYLR